MILNNYNLKMQLEMDRFETFHYSENLATITEPIWEFTSRLIKMKIPKK